MKGKKYFLFILCILMLFTFYSIPRLATGAQLLSRSTSGGEMKSSASSGGSVNGALLSAGAVARKGGTTREFRWVKENRSAPADKSARGALDGSSFSNKGNTFTTTVLADTIKVGQQADGSTMGVYKSFLSFDTSGIPQNAENISMDLVIYVKRPVVNGEGRDFYIEVFKSVYVDPLWNSDWGAIKGPPLETEDSRINVTQLNHPADPNASVLTIDPDSCRHVIHIRDPLSLIDWGGTTKLALVSSQTFANADPAGNEYVEIYSPNAAKKELRPALIINYDGTQPQVKPTLSFLAGDTYYKDTTAYPDQVYEGTTPVTFRVRYISAAPDGNSGNLPSVHQLLIDLNGDGTYGTGEVFDMAAVDDGDLDCSDGKDYQTVVNIVSNGKGSDIKYQFRFLDGTTEAGGTPATVQTITAIQTSKDSKSSNNLCFISSIRW